MSTGKTILTLTTGIVAGLAAAYLADPKGSQRKLRKVEKELKKTKMSIDKKLLGYKKNYNDLVGQFVGKSTELLDQAKGMIDKKEQVVKAS